MSSEASTALTASDRLEFLKVEAEHFYKSELHSEQRASWLLTIALGVEAVVLNGFVLLSDGKIHARVAPVLLVCSMLLFCTIALALFAIWPLEGRSGKLARPRRVRSSSEAACMALPFSWEEHYFAHRRRAEIKTRRVVWTLISLLSAIGVGGIGALVNR
jgi:hypothetical protein